MTIATVVRISSCMAVSIASIWFAAGPVRAAGWLVEAAQNDLAHPQAPMGEGQIAVIPPGTNDNCKNGRIILSADVGAATTDDTPVTKIISWRDIGTDTLTSGTVRSAKTGAGDIKYVSNDQSLVALPAGLLLWQIPAAYKQQIPLPSKPGSIQMKGTKPWWFDHTFRVGFGPGTRSASVSFVSKDCGQTFEFAPNGVVDAYFELADLCANPQPVGDPVKDAFGKPVVPTVYPAPFDMGGSDGALASVDRAKNRIYLTASCVGRLRGPDNISTGKPQLSANFISFDGKDGATDVARSDVFASDNGGKTWKRVGKIPADFWRAAVVVLGDGTPVIGSGTGVWLGTK